MVADETKVERRMTPEQAAALAELLQEHGGAEVTLGEDGVLAMRVGPVWAAAVLRVRPDGTLMEPAAYPVPEKLRVSLETAEIRALIGDAAMDEAIADAARQTDAQPDGIKRSDYFEAYLAGALASAVLRAAGRQ